MLAIKLISLTIFIWFFTVNNMKGMRGSNVPAANFVFMSVSAVAFIWSMGWLS